ncbi:putative hydro-lyase [Planococcus sp. ISL-109]|uniref:putative hydro-lyase n=1 Tax=Planococcus sp. ISL-109 TaxID=2819166 RepID=UPI001BE9B49D|nr:putative hydro-lyase [Planococcus sp. ISL-109]MBT2581522.1 putative hydro-lyase [Planococcus sp. ISL-109]
MSQTKSPEQLRSAIRKGDWQTPTSGLAPGFIQTNLAILPKEMAFEFLLFCQRNPKACPVIDVTEPGSFVPVLSAPTADLRTDVPKYRVYRDGVLTEETADILHLWTDDMVAFLLGCSFTFEEALAQNGIPMRHQEQGCNVPMYKTSIPALSAGRFQGPIVVSMRPIREQDIVRAVQVTSRFPNVHGAPIHIGNPESIGIQDIGKPDFGDAVTIKEGEVPVFWACGVTPQAVAMESKPPLMITHAPGHMFVTDLKSEDFSVF